MFNPDISGNSGGKTGGVGIALINDSRDNTSYPSSGFFGKFSSTFFRKPFGSDFTFDKYILDLRKYIMPIESHIFALQFYGEFTKGNTPFFSMPSIGGSYKMRGFFEGRYRDKQYFMAQAEYRKILFWRVGAAVFYSTGQVANNFSSFKLSNMRHSYGIGLRFVFDKKEKINLRMDLGIAEGNKGIYFNMEEAF